MAYVDDTEIDDLLETEGDDEDDNDEDAQYNPVISRGQEHRNEPTMASNLPVQVKRQIAAVWDEQGNAQVAFVVDGRQVEPFRAPTAEEWAELRARGRFVKGGLSGDAPAAVVPAAGGVNWMKYALIGTVVVVGGVLAYQKAREFGIIGGGDVEPRMNEADEDDDDDDE